MKKITKLGKTAKNNLGSHIDNYLINERISQSEFARRIDEELYKGYDNKDKFEKKETNNKTVSRWVTGDVFPDTPSLIAISNLLNVSVDELLKEEINTSSKTKDLSNDEINVLKIMLCEVTKDLTSSVYAPLSFNDENLDFNCFYLRSEVVEAFKEKTLKAYTLARLEDFANLLTKDNANVMNKYFSKFISSIVLEEELTEIKERISFDNTDECYKKLQKVWEATSNYDVYNVITFVEKNFIMPTPEDKEEFGKDSLGKDPYYKNITKINEKYQKSFATLIEKGIISPVNDTTFTFEFDDDSKFNTVSLNAEQFTDFVEIIDEEENEGDYKLRTLKFNFKINLTKADLKQFDKELLEKKYK
ncbi:MAG: helix-turn-helix transcriptional regulator [Clostridia bacterium]|nr:helix-turn-helix transcriptional regulator [Clostridia bacterium]